MDKIKELLAVLDLAEKKQVKWLEDLYFKKAKKEFDYLIDFALGIESLADLAFRLRNEAVKKSIGFWREGELGVFYHTVEPVRHKVWRVDDLDMWFVRYAQPIHFIIAALIAKELAKKDE